MKIKIDHNNRRRRPVSQDAVYHQLDQGERRLIAAAAATPVRRPWIARERAAIIRIARECLGVHERFIPEIQISASGVKPSSGVKVEHLVAWSWPGCMATAHLYRPCRPAQKTWPLVILCCGHGAGGKQCEGYQRMAWRLARMGAAVLVPDNIGQGERVPMGHRNAIGPFRCGLSMQGLIIMETIGWLRWAQ
ncbi:MAG: hypothetical protein LC725_10090, partial [Lentisphaerae bacterium]|nr:hypothetical protein [Lentisphaerota bacterium]